MDAKTIKSPEDFFNNRFTKSPDVVWSTKVDSRFLVEVVNTGSLNIYDMNSNGKRVVYKALRNVVSTPERIIRWQNVSVASLDKVMAKA